MKRIIALVAAASVVSGFQYDGLRVKFGWSDALADIEYFYHIPRTSSDAEIEGWRRTERPKNSPLPELRLYCLSNKGVCAFYDVGGFVAGLQIALPVDDFESLAVKPEKKMKKWRPGGSEAGERAKEYWYLPQFFVSEESLRSGTGPQIENGATLQDGGVWVPDVDGRLMRIPSTEVELNSTAFKKQNCIPNMGTHYYYNMTHDTKCEEFLPWFALASQGELVGTGFQMFGKLSRKQQRDWFEQTPSAKQSAQITIPRGPPCLYEWADAYGVISIHIYYIDNPWKIRCNLQKENHDEHVAKRTTAMEAETRVSYGVSLSVTSEGEGDSVKPPEVVDRLLLNGYRYANKITDEVKRLFSLT